MEFCNGYIGLETRNNQTMEMRENIILLFIYYYARWQPYTYKTVIYTIHSYTKIKNIKTYRNNMT